MLLRCGVRRRDAAAKRFKRCVDGVNAVSEQVPLACMHQLLAPHARFCSFVELAACKTH